MKSRMGSLTFKMFMICFAFALICVAIISHLSSRFVKEQAVEWEHEYVSRILATVNEYLALNFTTMQTILFSVDSLLGTGEFNETQLGNQLDYLYEANIQHISNVYILKDNYSIIGGRTITRVANEPLPELEPVYRQAKASLFSTSVSPPYDSRFSGRTVTVSRVSKYVPSLVVAVDVSIDELESKLLQIHRQEKVRLYILDYGGDILAHSDEAAVSGGKHGNVGGLDPERIVGADSSTLAGEDGEGTGQWIRKLHSPAYNWLLVAVSDGSRLNQTLSRIDRHFVFLLTVGMALSAAIAAAIARYIRRPVFALIKKMRKVESGDLDVRVDMNRNDEFGYLSRTFDSMLIQMKELFAHLNANKELQRRLEIQVLQAQINPHFLYNTLGAISNVVKLGWLDKVDPVIRSLIAILEYGVGQPSEKVTLEEELQNVRDYLVIQNIRYNREFRLAATIEPQLRSCEVFRMFLQPLVENSLFHGYRGGREDGEIRIDACERGQRIIITVSDDGVGIEPDKLAGLLREHEPEPGADQRKRIGLANIHGRIRLHYGETYGLSIAAEPGRGTSVRAELPSPYGRETL